MPRNPCYTAMGLLLWVANAESLDLNVPWSTVKIDFMLKILSASSEADLVLGSSLQEQHEPKVFLSRYLLPVGIYSLSLGRDGIITMFPFWAPYEPSFVPLDSSHPTETSHPIL